MKKLQLKTILSLFLVFTLFAQCSDDDNDNTIKELTVSNDYLFLKANTNGWSNDDHIITITSGNGDYKIAEMSGIASLVDIEIVGNEIKFKSKDICGAAGYSLSDSQGKIVEIKVVVDYPYMLLETNSITAEVKASESTVANAIKGEILKDTPPSIGSVCELIDELGELKLKIYNSMKDAADNKDMLEGNFSLDTAAPYMTFGLANTQYTFGLSSATILPSLYKYFKVEMNFDPNAERNSSAPVDLILYYDLTPKYQEKYPDSDIEYARVRIFTQVVAYKYISD